MIVDELRRLTTWSERHRRLLARILIALGLSAFVDLVGALLAWKYESRHQGQRHSWIRRRTLLRQRPIAHDLLLDQESADGCREGALRGTRGLGHLRGHGRRRLLRRVLSEWRLRLERLQLQQTATDECGTRMGQCSGMTPEPPSGGTGTQACFSGTGRADAAAYSVRRPRARSRLRLAGLRSLG